MRNEPMPALLEFMFDDMPVGYFQESKFPVTDGRYRYEPYRGPGHYEMGVRLQEAGRAQCYYDSAAERVFFTVQRVPEYGVLELIEFERSRA